MQERLESLFGRANPGWVPPVDLAEFDDRYVLSVELAGLRRENVRIDLREHTLTVSGQRPGEGCCPERYQQLERGQGYFSRSFRFALPIDTNAIAAELTDGVLTITIPKTHPSAMRVDVR